MVTNYIQKRRGQPGLFSFRCIAKVVKIFQPLMNQALDRDILIYMNAYLLKSRNYLKEKWIHFHFFNLDLKRLNIFRTLWIALVNQNYQIENRFVGYQKTIDTNSIWNGPVVKSQTLFVIFVSKGRHWYSKVIFELILLVQVWFINLLISIGLAHHGLLYIGLHWLHFNFRLTIREPSSSQPSIFTTSNLILW